MEWAVNVTPLPLYLRERAGTHCVGGWVGSRVGQEGCRKSRLHPHPTGIRPSSPPRVTIPTDLSRPPFMETEGLIITSSPTKGLLLQNTSDPVCVVKVGIYGHIKLCMETNVQVHISVALLQGKYPLLAHWIGSSTSPSVGMELAGKEVFRHAGNQAPILR